MNETTTIPPVVCGALVRLPAVAKGRAFGGIIWFIEDARGIPIAQMMPPGDEAGCRELVRLINLGASKPNASTMAPADTQSPKQNGTF